MSAKGTILIVDDEPDIVETLEFALRRAGFTIRVATNGADAIEMARKEPPDLMLLDVMMPGLNGYEVSRQLKEPMGLDRSYPIVLLTARRLDSQEREEFVSTWSQADAVLYKPFSLDRLMSQIELLLARKAAGGVS